LGGTASDFSPATPLNAYAFSSIEIAEQGNGLNEGLLGETGSHFIQAERLRAYL